MIVKISNFLITRLTKLYIKKVSGTDNLPKNGPYVIVANHASYFDHFIILTLIKIHRKQSVHFVTKKEAFDSFLSRKWHLSMGAIPLNREGSDTSAFRTVVNSLKNNKIVCIYPEGTRSPTGKLYKGKNGAIRMAMAADVPIVPIGMQHTFDILPRKRLIPRRRKANVSIGKPMYLKATKDKQQLSDILDKLMVRIQSLSKSPEAELNFLPKEEEDYKQELIETAYDWNERGIRNYPVDTLRPADYHKRAIYICEEILKMDNSNAKAYFEMARAYGRLGINNKFFPSKLFYLFKARASLNKAIKYDENYAGSYYALAVWYTQMPKILYGNPKRALDYYLKANKLQPEIYIQVGLANNLIELGEIERAKIVLQQLIQTAAPKTNVDVRRKLEAIVLMMRLDPNYKIEDRMMTACFLKSENG